MLLTAIYLYKNTGFGNVFDSLHYNSMNAKK